MANSYLVFSTVIEATPEEKDWWHNRLETDEEGILKRVVRLSEEGKIQFCTEDSPGLDLFVLALADFCKKYNRRVAISMAYYCDKLRPKAFGGVVLLASPDGCFEADTDLIADAWVANKSLSILPITRL